MALALRFAAESKKLEAAPPLPKMLPLVLVRLAVVAVIVAAAFACVRELVVVRVNVVPAEDAP